MLLITPPFSQLNTPYPATPYLKGFLNTISQKTTQVDLSIELILKLFSSQGLRRVFDEIEQVEMELTENTYRILLNRDRYIQTIDPVVAFLQNKNQTLAHAICNGSYLPEAQRFQIDVDMEWAFGTMGIHDKARYLATLYLEDLGDLVSETIDQNFGFSRYAERISRTATHFSKLHKQLHKQHTLIVQMLEELVIQKVKTLRPAVVCITIPFPGNVFSALKCAQIIKQNSPHIKIILGGGYANTELRSLTDKRVFEYVDYITLDDGEAPLQQLLEFLKGKRPINDLKRTWTLTNEKVEYINNSEIPDIHQSEVGTPDYSDLQLNDYLSVIEVANPMHRLWSDGRWNKLTIAHGCYWAKCSFCDVSLDYIKRYQTTSAEILCDRIEAIIQQTGQHGFHFVDEAAPPVVLRDMAIEILRRGLSVVWWTNIRFEKNFTSELCQLLKASGCIAVSGGLEVASDRLLRKMNKGVTVSQVARVAKAFTNAGIMVHAYLMYGFPTETEQETVDSLEMVRQLFKAEAIQSGFWHQFAMTAHSPVGINPKAFGVKATGPTFGGFARNDLYHSDPLGAEHEKFSDGLKSSLFNYMHGIGIDQPLSFWFNFSVPKPSVSHNFIDNALTDKTASNFTDHQQVMWLGGEIMDVIEPIQGNRKKKTSTMSFTEIIICGQHENFSIFFETAISQWVIEILQKAALSTDGTYTIKDMKVDFETLGLSNFDSSVNSENFQLLLENGLLIL